MTVADVKRQIIEEIYSERGENFGLKLEGKRKARSVRPSDTCLELNVEAGSMFIVDFADKGIIGAQKQKSRGATDEEKLDAYGLIVLPGEENEKEKRSQKKTKRNEDAAAPSKKSKKPVAVVNGSFGHEKGDNIAELTGFFMDGEGMSPQSANELGNFLFSQFTTAARIDALEKRKVTIKKIHERTDEDVPPLDCLTDIRCNPNRIVAAFQSTGKSYEESSELLEQEVIRQLAREVLERSSTKRRRNISGVRGMFTVNSLAARAPWVLWSMIFHFGADKGECERRIGVLLDQALKEDET